MHSAVGASADIQSIEGFQEHEPTMPIEYVERVNDHDVEVKRDGRI